MTCWSKFRRYGPGGKSTRGGLADSWTWRDRFTFYSPSDTNSTGRLYDLPTDARNASPWRRRSRNLLTGHMPSTFLAACKWWLTAPPVLLRRPTVGVDPQQPLRLSPTSSLHHANKTTWRKPSGSAIARRSSITARFSLAHRRSSHRAVRRRLGDHRRVSPARRPFQLPGTWTGDQLRIETSEPLPVIAKLLGMGEPLHTLRLERPDLETVFLSLTGRRLRD